MWIERRGDPEYSRDLLISKLFVSLCFIIGFGKADQTGKEETLWILLWFRIFSINILLRHYFIPSSCHVIILLQYLQSFSPFVTEWKCWLLTRQGNTCDSIPYHTIPHKARQYKRLHSHHQTWDKIVALGSFVRSQSESESGVSYHQMYHSNLSFLCFKQGRSPNWKYVQKCIIYYCK